MFQSSKIVKRLFYANIIIFLSGLILQGMSVPFYETFSLYPHEGFQLHQLITHQFMHGGFAHIIFNMLALISIGPQVEDYLGEKKFLLSYLLCGLGAAFLHLAMSTDSIPIVGASGAIYGIFLMFAVINPDEKLYFFGLLGMKSKYLATILFSIEILSAFMVKGDGIGHFAHVGGGITGLVILFINNKLLNTNKNKSGRRWT